MESINKLYEKGGDDVLDRTSYIAGILYYLTNDADVKKVAIKILNGELTLKEASKNKTVKRYLSLAEKQFKSKNVSEPMHKQIIEFIEKNLYEYI